MDDRTIRLMVKAGLSDEAYVLRVEELIRERYSVSAELAILRQKDSKPKEFADYNDFAEACKAIAHKEVFGE